MCGPNDDMTNPANLEIYVPQRDESGRLDAEKARAARLTERDPRSHNHSLRDIGLEGQMFEVRYDSGCAGCDAERIAR